MDKQSQVALMPNVYHNASEVMVWLGEESLYSAQGMDMLRYLVRNHEDINEPPPWRHRSPQLFQSGIEDIMARPWWKRGWVVQELALSTKTRMMCGPDAVSWQAQTNTIQEIIKSIKIAEISFEWGENGFASVSLQPLLDFLQEQLNQCRAAEQEQAGKWTIPPPKSGMVDLMHNFRNKMFSDPRDRIFAVQGLVSDVAIQPDYSMPVAKVWETLMRAVGRQAPPGKDSFKQGAPEDEIAQETTISTRIAGQNKVTTSSEEICRLQKQVQDLQMQNFDLENVNQTLWERFKEVQVVKRR
jgi:hypothetical protein